MSFGIFLIALLMAESLESAAVNNSVKIDDMKVPERSARTYDDRQQYISIPVGYFKQDQDSPSTESEDDSTPKYDVPTSFDDFKPSDNSPKRKYPVYYKSKGDTYKGIPLNWKGDSAGGNGSPSWMVPSPADMTMMMNMMKDMNGGESPDVPGEPTGLLSKFISDPAAFISAIMLPTAILLGAVIPVLVSMFMNSASGSIPTVTTVATGGSGRKLSENPSFVKPILEIIENFNARGVSEQTCLQKSFCEATRGANSTEFRPIQKSIYKAFTFVDDYWLEALGVKELMEAMGSGNCDRIQCATSKAKESDTKKKRI